MGGKSRGKSDEEVIRGWWLNNGRGWRKRRKKCGRLIFQWSRFHADGAGNIV